MVSQEDGIECIGTRAHEHKHYTHYADKIRQLRDSMFTTRLTWLKLWRYYRAACVSTETQLMHQHKHNSFPKPGNTCVCTESPYQISGGAPVHEHTCWAEKQANGAGQLSTSITSETHLAN